MEKSKKMKRNIYLLDSALRLNIVSAIISSVVLNLNSFADGILMGQFLGENAFAAINLCSPIMFIQGGLSMLVAGGASIIMSVNIGEGNEEKIQRIYTAAIILNILTGVIFFCFALFGTNAVTDILCRTETLSDYVSQYSSLILGFTIVFMFRNLVFKEASICGTPEIIIIGSVIEVGVNLFFDWLFVVPLRLGVYGAALATVLSAFVAWLAAYIFIKRKNNIFRICRMNGEFLKSVKEIFEPGVSLLVGIVAIGFFILLINTLIQKYCGTKGTFVIAVSIQIVNVCLAVTIGCSTSFTALGGFLTGQKDYAGTRILFRKIIFIAVVSATVISLLVIAGAPMVVRLFGAKTQDIVDYATVSIRSAILFVIPFTVLNLMPHVYAIAQKNILILLTQITIPMVFGLFLWLFGEINDAAYIWISFPLAGLVLLLFSMIVSEAVRRKSSEKRAFYSLLRIAESDIGIFDISIACEMQQVRKAILELLQFLENEGLEKALSDKICHCAEEALLNVVEHAGRTEQQYMDLRIMIEPAEIQLMLKDNGKPFDPTCTKKGRNGLKILVEMCSDIEYSYKFGQNILIMKWPYSAY